MFRVALSTLSVPSLLTETPMEDRLGMLVVPDTGEYVYESAPSSSLCRLRTVGSVARTPWPEPLSWNCEFKPEITAL